MEELTDQQAKVLRFITNEIEVNGAPPTYRAIAKHFRFASTRAAQDHVAALIRKGHLERKPGISRGLRLPGRAEAVKNAPLAVPILGLIAAGSPRDNPQIVLGTCAVPRDVAKGIPEDELFALRVTGDSMISAGILDGDLVIARQTKTAANGDIVVALLDDETTVKRFQRKDGRVFLVPENPRMKPIPAAGRELEIQGKVIGVQRFYRS